MTAPHPTVERLRLRPRRRSTLYRDIHKGIRAELFAVTSTAGSLDPTDRCGRAALADHVMSVGQVLELHAHHEDAVVDPVLVEHLPRRSPSRSATTTTCSKPGSPGSSSWPRKPRRRATSADQRRLGHLLYLELSGFTSAYLAHQIVEERVVMPALEQAVGVEAVRRHAHRDRLRRSRRT